jgi:nucleoside-diphosphate-sugar epimerase
MPSYVIGKSELVSDTEGITKGSNVLAIGQVLGYSPPVATAGASVVHIDDVAKAHVLVLNSSVPGNTNYLLHSGGLEGSIWGDAIDIVAKNYPEAIPAGLLPNNGLMKTLKLSIDGSKAEKILGIKFLSYEEQVKSVVGHYLELQAA